MLFSRNATIFGPNSLFYPTIPNQAIIKEESPPPNSALPKNTFQYITFHQTLSLDRPFPLAINVTLKEAYLVKKWRRHQAKKEDSRHYNYYRYKHSNLCQYRRSHSPRSPFGYNEPEDQVRLDIESA